MPNRTKFAEDYSLYCVQKWLKLMILLKIKSFLHNSLAMLNDGINIKYVYQKRLFKPHIYFFPNSDIDFSHHQVIFCTCPPNWNDVLRIGQRVRPIFLHLGRVSGSGDMCRQIKHGRFFEKMSFSQPRGGPEKVWGHIFM